MTIERGVTGIGDYAFAFCSCLARITIADSVERIGDSAFLSCQDLANVTIPESVTSIGDFAFTACSLRSIRIPAGTKVAENAFKGCPDVVIDREEP